MRIVMGIKFCVKPSLEKLKESDGFGAEIEVEINGKEFVLALCYIVQALAAILATVTFAVASCDEATVRGVLKRCHRRCILNRP